MHETNITVRTFRVHARPGRLALCDILSRIPSLLMQWQRRSSERTHLRDLDAYLLDDVGMSRTDRDREARKPFWRR